MPNPKADKIYFRKPKLKPYFDRALDHWKWNAKSIWKKQAALRDRVNGKTVLLTGASSGIGEQVAEHLAQAGARVLLVARSREKLELIADNLHKNGGTAFVYTADLSNGEEVDALCQQVIQNHAYHPNR